MIDRFLFHPDFDHREKTVKMGKEFRPSGKTNQLSCHSYLKSARHRLPIIGIRQIVSNTRRMKVVKMCVSSQLEKPSAHSSVRNKFGHSADQASLTWDVAILVFADSSSEEQASCLFRWFFLKYLHDKVRVFVLRSHATQE